MPKSRFGLNTVWLVLGLVLPILVVHYGVSRDSVWLVPICGISFLAYVFFYLTVEFTFSQLLIVALLIRLGLFFGSPTLSDDYFRFVWDGQIRSEGRSPYQSTPEQLIGELPEDLSALYMSLNSKEYHSTYPPISQYIFSIPAWLGIQDISWSVTIIRTTLLLFEIGVMWLMFQLTASVSKVLIYALNPLVILELVGNLHFEGVVIFFILFAWWLYDKGYWIKAATALSFGILTKLTPLMFLPVLFKKLGFQKSLLSYIVIGLTLIIISFPFMDLEILKGLGNGLDLFFRKFEFNAGLFFLFREIGYWYKGYDMVQTLGPWLSYTALGAILIYSLIGVNKDTNWAKTFTIILFVQLLFATTVHPWYVIPLLAFTVISGYAFPVIWSFLVLLSYLGYSDVGYEHPFSWIALEHIVIVVVAGYEFIKDKPLLKNV